VLSVTNICIVQDVENLNTDNLMRLQVEQLEKEKREREARLRVIAKRIDHVERAYRQEERPLLAKDYELQQASDRATFEQVQKARIDSARLDHKRNLETKKRLARILPEFESRKAIILDKRGAEYERKQAAAQAKIEEEKAKRIAAVLKAREEERLHEEAVEQARREEEEAEQSRQEGALFRYPRTVVCLTSPPQKKIQRKNASVQRKKPQSSRQKQRSSAIARSANDSARQTSSVSSCSSSARKRRHGEPRSDAGNRLSLSPLLPPRRQRHPRALGAALALRLLSPLLRLHRLARPRVLKAQRRPALRLSLVVVVPPPRRAGVRARQRMLRVRHRPPHRRERMRISRRR
jgi:translation initiation factor 3 subunit A